MEVQLSDHITYRRLLVFTAPTAAMMVFSALYGIVDGLFVSNFTGKVPFAALNLVWPFVQVMTSFGLMLGTGGSALVAKTLGEGDPARANRHFSLIVYFGLALGVVLAALGAKSMPAVATFLGAEPGLFLDSAVLYGTIMMCFMPAAIMQGVFQSMCATAGKPRVGLFVTVFAGVANMVLDAVFVAGFSWGIVGAALATGASQVVAGFVPLAYFARRRNGSLLKLGSTGLEWGAIGRTCSNGVSEMMTGLAMSIVTVLYNWQLMEFIGTDGVAAYGAIAYMSWMFISIFLGFSFGTAPLVGFNFGARNKGELSNILRKAAAVVMGLGVVMFALAQLTAVPFSNLFVGYDPDLADLTTHGLRIYSFSFLLCGATIFGSAFFTALSNGKVSAFISFMHSLVFETASVMLLPQVMGIDGIWSAIIVAEVLAAALTGAFIWGLRDHYGYLGDPAASTNSRE